MSLISEKISGCYRRVFIFIFATLIVAVCIGLFVYNRVGGVEGMQYWMAERALNGTEKLLLKNRPDGIPQETVETQFQNVRDAIGNRQIDLISLYDVLNSFQTKFHAPGPSIENIKPSTPEVDAFLTQLDGTIIRDE